MILNKKGGFLVKKFLSGLLVFALTFGCCEPCYGAKVEQDQITASNNEKENEQKELLIKFLKSAQEKEIKAIKQRLKEFNSKQFEKIDKIESMSTSDYGWHKFKEACIAVAVIGSALPVSYLICKEYSIEIRDFIYFLKEKVLCSRDLVYLSLILTLAYFSKSA